MNEALSLLESIRSEASQMTWGEAAYREINLRLSDRRLKDLPPPVRHRILDVARLSQFHHLTPAGLAAIVQNPERFRGHTSAQYINDHAPNQPAE